MIVGIKGRLVSSTPVSAVVETCGLFYEVGGCIRKFLYGGLKPGNF